MKTVLLFGTFDFLHSGHLHAFQEAKALGDRLVVSIARDKIVEQIKGKAPIHDEAERLGLVQHIEIVDDAFLGDEELGVYSFFSDVKPDVIALGYDQQELKQDIERFLEESGNKATLVTISAYKDGATKSSGIKNELGL